MTRRTAIKITAAAAALAALAPISPFTYAKGTNAMKYRGVVYDVGLRFTEGLPFSVEHFDPKLVDYDIKTIATQLHANAIRIEGEDIDRLVTATRLAHEAGLTVLFNPWKMNVPIAELPAYFSEAALAAEQLRSEGVDLIFVAGCEMSLFNQGIFAGSTQSERTQKGLMPLGNLPQAEALEVLAMKLKLLNEELHKIVVSIREKFNGTVTYSAGIWERVDWSLFDVVGVDHYRSNETAEAYVKTLDHYRVGKPLIVMEVGACTYEGAAKLGSSGYMILEGMNPDGTGVFKEGVVPNRSEQEQADYVEEQVRLLSTSNVEGVFIFLFSFPSLYHGEGAADLDMVSFSLVKNQPQNHPKSRQMPPWKPKEAFYRLAKIYQEMATQ